MKTIQPPKEDTKTTELLAREIKKAIREFYFEVLKQDKTIFNSVDSLESSIISGKIYYEKGAFKGKFNSVVSKRLKFLGAKWKNGAYYLPQEKIPVNYLSAIAQGKMMSDRQIQKMIENLMGVDPKKIATKVDVKKIIDKAVFNLNKHLDENIHKSVPTVRAQFDEVQLEQIRKKYSENMDLHIVGWADEEIKTLRKKINEDTRAGKRYEQIAQEIEKKFNMAPKKALFIARQETHLLVAEMNEQKMRKAGFKRYIWKTRSLPVGFKKGNVRPDHAELDGKIFDWDNPPVVDHKTGRRAHPKQDFNCRCDALSLVS